MPFGFNVLSGKQDLKELPLRIVTTAPTSEDLSEGEIVIYKDGANKWIYWKTQSVLYRAQGVLV